MESRANFGTNIILDNISNGNYMEQGNGYLHPE